MGKDTGFKEFDRKVPGYDSVESRIKHYNEFLVPLKQEDVEIQGARCMNCGVPFCHNSCPLGNIIPDFNDQVYRGKWLPALKTLLSTNNFPEFTGKICPAPCESGCVASINTPAITIKNIELSTIEKGFAEGWMTPKVPANRTGKNVAVIGSGPAGLAAADQLNKAGHMVTVLERAKVSGGLLRQGIPDFKLDKKIVQRRIDLMKAEGVIFRNGAHVGVNVPAQEILDEFDAVVLSGGSTKPRDLPIPGREGVGVHAAMDFLSQNSWRVQGGEGNFDHRGNAIDLILAKGKNVLVIGGGDTGSDCVGTSIRQGAKSVLQIELLPKPAETRTEKTPWPTHPGPAMLSTSTSQAEGCKREWSIGSKEILRDASGNVRGVKAVKLDWSNGKPEEVAGSEYVIEAELVLLAMGFLSPEPTVLEAFGVEKDERGNCKSRGFATTKEKVFTAGDMRRGQSLVVIAISEGREAAREVDAFLSAGPSLLAARSKSKSDVVLA
jgi:glutamate synthase (NADPH) small chain